MSQSFPQVGLPCRMDDGFLHSHLTETGAMLVSALRRKHPGPPSRVYGGRDPSQLDPLVQGGL